MMLKKLVDIIDNSRCEIKGGTLFCSDWIVTDNQILIDLNKHNCFEQSIFIDDIKINSSVSLELSISELSKIGFYDSCEYFILKNRYERPDTPYYIYELKTFDTDSHIFIKQYTSIQNLISSIKRVAKHTFLDIEIENAIISNEKLSVIISFDYSSDALLSIDTDRLSKIDLIIKTLDGDNLEKRNLFTNEIIDFMQRNVTDKIDILLVNIDDLYNNCESAYSFYISNYSSNKLKFEIDSKAIEFTQKIQSVINEAQSRLIAIPSAFVLAALAMDFEKSQSPKNYVTIISLFVFALLIQLFINNQYTILKFINENIDEFKQLFSYGKNNKLLLERFLIVEKAQKKQKCRFIIINVILWFIPIVLLILFIILNSNNSCQQQ
jgi:hypothetical protein